MMLGLSLGGFTLLHVVISLIGIAAGAVWLAAVIRGREASRWNAVFLTATVLTSLTGFLFPFHGMTPALAVGIVSSLDLALAGLALALSRRGRLWRLTYVASAGLALYLNSFVLVVQSFLKIPPLHALAPTGTEPPFALAQGLLLLAALALGWLALRQTLRQSRLPPKPWYDGAVT